MKQTTYTPFLLLFFLCAYFYPYLFGGKVMVPFQIFSGNPLVLKEPWMLEIRGQQNEVGFDLISQFYPWKETIRQSYLNGFLPLWNSHNQGGAPFIANIQTGYFYPANIFLLFFTTPVAVTLMSIFNILVAALGTYFFLLVLGINPFVSGLGAIGFIQCGYLVHWFQWVPHLGAMAWFPWMMGFTRLFLTHGKTHWLLGAMGATSLSIFSGHIQFSYYGILSVFLYAVFLIPEGAELRPLRDRLKRTCVFLFLFGCGALLLSACQLWPSWELAQHSLRGEENLHHLRATAFEYYRILTLWSKNFLGSYEEGWAWRGIPLELDNLHLPLFLSGILIPACWASIFTRQWHPFIGLGLLSLGTAFGEKVIFTLMGLIPLFDHFRSPSRMGFVFCFAAVCLGALFLSNLMKEEAGTGKRPLWKTYPYLLTALVFSLFAGLFWGCSITPAPRDEVARHFIFTLVVLAGYQTALILMKHKSFLIYGLVLFFSLAGAEILVSDFPFNPKMPKPESGLLRFKPPLEDLAKYDGMQGRLIRASRKNYDGLSWISNLNLLSEISDVQGYDTFIRKEFITYWQGVDLPSLEEYARKENLVRNFRPEELTSPSLKLLGTRYALASSSLPLPILGRMGPVFFHELPGALPRIFLLPEDVKGEDHDEVLRHAKDFSPSYEISTKSIPNGYEAEIQPSASARLVLGELHYPGWRAWVDGHEVPVEPFARGLISTHLEKGRHGVVLRYSPRSFFVALALSLLGWTGLLGYGVYILVKRS